MRGGRQEREVIPEEGDQREHVLDRILRAGSRFDEGDAMSVDQPGFRQRLRGAHQAASEFVDAVEFLTGGQWCFRLPCRDRGDENQREGRRTDSLDSLDDLARELLPQILQVRLQYLVARIDVLLDEDRVVSEPCDSSWGAGTSSTSATSWSMPHVSHSSWDLSWDIPEKSSLLTSVMWCRTPESRRLGEAAAYHESRAGPLLAPLNLPRRLSVNLREAMERSRSVRF